MTGGVLIFCGGKRTLARPVGFGWLRCALCGRLFKGVER